jgi:hypothetical protein
MDGKTMNELFKALQEVVKMLRVGSENTERTRRLILLMVATSVIVLGVFLGVSLIAQHIWL